MKRIQKVAIWLWVLFLINVLVMCIMWILRAQGGSINSLLCLMAPVSCFIGASAHIATSESYRYTSAWNDPKKRSTLQIRCAILNGFAFSLTVVGIAFFIGLVIPINRDWIRLIAVAGAALIFILGLRRVKKINLLVLIILLSFLYMFFRSLIILLAKR